jgi:hypothetical protein
MVSERCSENIRFWTSLTPLRPLFGHEREKIALHRTLALGRHLLPPSLPPLAAVSLSEYTPRLSSPAYIDSLAQCLFSGPAVWELHRHSANLVDWLFHQYSLGNDDGRATAVSVSADVCFQPHLRPSWRSPSAQVSILLGTSSVC